jgi:hypothetical protein
MHRLASTCFSLIPERMSCTALAASCQHRICYWLAMLGFGEGASFERFMDRGPMSETVSVYE